MQPLARFQSAFSRFPRNQNDLPWQSSDQRVPRRLRLSARLIKVTVAVLAVTLGLSGTGWSAESPPPAPNKEDSKATGTGTSSTQTGPIQPADKVAIPSVSTKRDAMLGNSDQNIRAQTGSGLDTTTNAQPGFDQGFRSQPGQINGGQMGGNPISSGNGCANGLIGSAACGSSGSSGAASQGSALIKDGVVTGAAGAVNAGLQSVTKGTAGVKIGNPTGKPNTLGNFGDQDLKNGLKGDVNNRQQQMDSASCDQGIQAACDRLQASQQQANSGTAEPAPAGGDEKIVVHPSGNTTEACGEGCIRHSQGNAGGSRTVTTVTKVKNKDGTTTTTVTKEERDAKNNRVGEPVVATSIDTPCDPSLCGSTPESIAKFYADNPALFNQLAQARSGGSGNVDPARGDDGAFTVSAGARAPVAGSGATNLVGNPGQRGGLGDTGSIDTRTDFGNSRGAGSINPGQDGNMATTGGRTENVDDRINGQPSRGLPAAQSSPNATTPSAQSKPTIQCTRNHPIPAFRCPE